jgi:BirA family biotin operon repressor/biotin-[acetyl-CoA-carboxylase] ligase
MLLHSSASQGYLGVDFVDVDQFAELWNKHDVLRGREVTLVEGSRKRRGKVLGIDDVGSLLLRDDHGHTRGFRAGEVTVDKDA